VDKQDCVIGIDDLFERLGHPSVSVGDHGASSKLSPRSEMSPTSEWLVVEDRTRAARAIDNARRPTPGGGAAEVVITWPLDG
jgi:hypothetical protein